MNIREAIERQRELTNSNCDPRISYHIGKSHTGENYVSKRIDGREDIRIYNKGE